MAVTDATPTFVEPSGAGTNHDKAEGDERRPSKRVLLICAIGAMVILAALVAYRLIPRAPAPAPPPPATSRVVPTTPTTAPNVQLPTGGATRDPFSPG